MKTNPIIILFLCLAVTIQCLAQKKVITDSNIPLQKGIYKTFDEFLSNAPSDKNEYFLHERSEAMQTWIAVNKNKLKYYDENGKQRSYNGSAWGFCDGNKTYIKFGGAFFPINVYPCFSHFIETGKVRHSMSPMMGANGMMMSGGSYVTDKHVDRVIDMETGNVHKLSNYRLIQILKSDPELLADYKNDRNRRDKRLNYLGMYNTRNRK